MRKLWRAALSTLLLALLACGYSLPEARTACRNGDNDACVRLEKGCNNNEPGDACYYWGLAYKGRDDDVALDFFRRSCDQGHAEGCNAADEIESARKKGKKAEADANTAERAKEQQLAAEGRLSNGCKREYPILCGEGENTWCCPNKWPVCGGCGHDCCPTPEYSGAPAPSPPSRSAPDPTCEWSCKDQENACRSTCEDNYDAGCRDTSHDNSYDCQRLSTCREHCGADYSSCLYRQCH